MKEVLFRKNSLVGAVVLVVSAMAGGGAAADTIVTEWDDATLQAIRNVHPAPTVVARSLAIVHTAIFDALAAYDPRALGTRFGAALRRPANESTEFNKRAAISYAAYTTLVDLFPSEKANLEAKMRTLGYDPANGSLDVTTAAGVGRVAALAVTEFHHKDGANQLGDMTSSGKPYADYTGYTSPNAVTNLADPNRWQPLLVSNHLGCHGDTMEQIWCTPHWGKVTPFGLKSGSQFRPQAPAKYGEQAYVDQAEQIVQITANLDDKAKVIAEYWMDGPTSELPPGHWAMLAKWVSNRDRHDTDKDVKLYFTLTNAMNDAGIAVWDAKRAYDSIRPISAIRFLYKNKTIPSYDGKAVLGQEWWPYQPRLVVTPPFAEYVSGHSAFSRAAAEVLKRFTGSDRFGYVVTIPAGQSRVQPGVVPASPVTLSYATFTDAADEAGLSRRYGGIHFEQGDLQGRELGRRVGAAVWAHAQQYIRDE